MPPQLGGIPLGGAPLGGTQGQAPSGGATTQSLTANGFTSTVTFGSATLTVRAIRGMGSRWGQSTSYPDNVYHPPLRLRASGIAVRVSFGQAVLMPQITLTALSITSEGKLGTAKISINTERIDEEALLQLLAA